MKRILQLLVCGLGIGLLFSSCSMFNYTTYTAKTMGIENRIVQMPTVVDLVVDSMRHEKDTAWENILFKKHTSVKNQMDYLIASILEESGADVLVEPKASLDVKMSWIRSNYKLSVTGYPARYVNFRPATMEDMLLLGMDTLDCRGDYPQVIINGAPGNWYDSRSVNRRMEAKGGVRRSSVNGGNMSPAVSAPQKEKKGNPKIMRKKYEGRFELRAALSFTKVYDYGGGYHSVAPAMAFTTHGANIGKKKDLFLGGGMGFGGDLYDNGDLFLPFYVDVRGNFGSRKFTPFLEVKVGPSVQWGDYLVVADDEWMHGPRMSMFYELSFGVSLGKHFDVGITHMGYVMTQNTIWDLGLKLGVRW